MLLLGVVLGVFYWWRNVSSPVGDNSESQRFVIAKGSSASTVSVNLEKEGLIKSALAFKIYVQVFDKSKNINAGEFNLSSSMTLQEIADALGKGPLELWVTIPEGLRREEVVQKFVKGLEKNGDTREVFIQEFLDFSKGQEGYLFPDTYLFPRDVSGKKVVEKMLSNFEIKYAEVGNNPKFDKKDIVIMASLIEKETKTDEERPLVSGILWKRIDAGWFLQVDACSQYFLGGEKCIVENESCDWWPELTLSDLENSNKYNTYKNYGLPPTPIANPGLTSLSAAANPTESTYWYYIHSPDGVIHFAVDLSEHNMNIRKYLGK